MNHYNNKYDQHSRKHSLKCQIGACRGWIRIYTERGDDDKAQEYVIRMGNLQAELDALVKGEGRP